MAGIAREMPLPTAVFSGFSCLPQPRETALRLDWNPQVRTPKDQEFFRTML